MLDPPAADRRHPQHELGVGGEAGEARRQQIGEQRRHHVRRRLVRPERRGAGQLLQEERVPLGPLEDGLRQRRVGGRPEDGGEQRDGIGPPEPLDAQVADARPAFELGDEAPQRVSGRQVVAAVGDDHRQRRRWARGGQVRDEVPGGAVRPVDVLDDQEHRTHLRRQPLEDPFDRLQRRRLALERTARTAVVAADQPQPRRVGPEDVGRRRTGGRRPARRAQPMTEVRQRLDDGRVGDATHLEVEASPDQDLHVAGAGPPRQLGHEARLADPRLAAHEHGRAAAFTAGVEHFLQAGEFPDATDQRRGVHPTDCRPPVGALSSNGFARGNASGRRIAAGVGEQPLLR